MRLFRTGMLLLMVPLMLAGKRVELRVDSPVQVSAVVAEEVGKELREAGEELQRGLSQVAPPAPMPSAILPIPQDAIVPDVFPSQRAAIRAAVQEWAKQLVLTSKELPTKVNISTPDDVHSDAVRELQGAVQRQLLGANCQIHQRSEFAHPMPQASPGVAWAEFEVVQGDEAGSGRVMLRGSAPALAVISMEYVSKPWVDSFAEFANRRPGVERWIVGESQRSCTSPAEATQDAMHQAADSVSGLLRTRLAGMRQMMIGVDQEWLVAKVQSELERGTLVRDRFVQRYERPYGTLWREAVLVDVSESSIDYLAVGIMNDLRGRHAAVRNTAVSVLGLLVVIYLLYLLANGVTKGYFVWRLRTAAVVLAAIGVVILMWFVTMPTQHDPSVRPASHAVPGYSMEY